MAYSDVYLYTNVEEGKEVFFVEGVKFFNSNAVVLDDLNILVALATNICLYNTNWSIEELAIYQGIFQFKEPYDWSIRLIKQAPNQFNAFIKDKITAMNNVLKDLKDEYGYREVSSITNIRTEGYNGQLQRQHPDICDFYLEHGIPEHTMLLVNIIAGK